jgi:hypothetical protein
METIAVANRKPVGGWLYRVVAAVSALVVFIGFSRSYFLRPLFRNTSLDLLLHLHGAIMTLWFLLFALQVSLVEKGRIDQLHSVSHPHYRRRILSSPIRNP